MGDLMKETLRVITAGSVDDGKSTLIGRLLFDAKVLTRDQLDLMAEDDQGAPDFAALTDGLIAEKEQGITIDVAYRYFTTETRRYILADCPGHEAYTRNMVTGASTADVAIILIDPTKLDFSKNGDDLLLIQTKRHSAVVVMLGVRHVVVAINKMDAIDFDQSKYKKIEEAYNGFYKKLWQTLRDGDGMSGGGVSGDGVSGGGDQPMIIPISAKEGDNIVDRSQKLGWYDGAPLLTYLDGLSVGGGDKKNIDGMMPVQYVLKDEKGVGIKFRGYQGRVESGVITRKQQVQIFPSGNKVGIKSIYNENGDEVEQGEVGQTITVQLDGEVEAGRGNYIVQSQDDKNATDQQVGQQDLQKTILCWFDKNSFSANSKYILKHTTRETFVKLSNAVAVDLNNIATDATGEDAITMNSIFSASIKLQDPILGQSYYDNRHLGSFILIDPVTFHTVAAGVMVG